MQEYRHKVCKYLQNIYCDCVCSYTIFVHRIQLLSMSVCAYVVTKFKYNITLQRSESCYPLTQTLQLDIPTQ